MGGDVMQPLKMMYLGRKTAVGMFYCCKNSVLKTMSSHEKLLMILGGNEINQYAQSSLLVCGQISVE
jgi:hypothetical protein